MLDELVKRRNNITRGADGDPVKEADYERLRKAVFGAMDELAFSVGLTVENAKFRRASPGAGRVGTHNQFLIPNAFGIFTNRTAR